jgi:transcriptional regulator with XRE-family HTH domain
VTGSQLRRIRERLDLTQAQLAMRLGVAANTLARWERDELPIREPIAKLIQMVANAAR